jgi:Trypsin-co-occurring domain 1
MDMRSTSASSSDRESDAPRRRLMELSVGESRVFVEVPLDDAESLGRDEIRAVAQPSGDPFEQAAAFVRECISSIDERLHQLSRRPDEVVVEFSLGFDVSGKAKLIPVLLSAEASTKSAIKVTARWGSGPS